VSTTGGAITGSPIERGAALTYFSFATLTTTGYGDLVPVHPLARSLANLEAVIGQLFPATLLARIVALHLEHSRRASDSDQPASIAASAGLSASLPSSSTQRTGRRWRSARAMPHRTPATLSALAQPSASIALAWITLQASTPLAALRPVAGSRLWPPRT
jgi:hypothetical protein